MRATAGTLLSEDFTVDPVAAGDAVIDGSAARFDYSSGSMLAHYDTGLATAKMRWPLGVALSDSTDFDFRVDFTIHSSGFFADPNGFAQIGFGLINESTTGGDRAGGVSGDAFDVVALDYFPNISPTFGGPSLSPTVVLSDNGTGFFSRIKFLSGLETGLDDEGPLPLDVSLRAEIGYDAASRFLTLTVSDAGGPLAINTLGQSFLPGGLDGDSTTIQNVLGAGDVFRVDSFALTLWQDTFGGGSSTVIADVTFTEIVVEAPGISVPLLGDVNSDGFVNGLDVNIVGVNFAAWPAGDAQLINGDANQDGFVNGLDVNIIGAHFGASAAAVPEPAGAVLLTIGLALWWRRRVVGRRGHSRDLQIESRVRS